MNITLKENSDGVFSASVSNSCSTEEFKSSRHETIPPKTLIVQSSWSTIKNPRSSFLNQIFLKRSVHREINLVLRNGWQRMLRRRAHQDQIRNRPRVGVSRKAASSPDTPFLSSPRILVSRFYDIDRPRIRVYPRLHFTLVFSFLSLAVAFHANCEMRLRLWCTGSEFAWSSIRGGTSHRRSLHRPHTLYRSIRESPTLVRLSAEQNSKGRGKRFTFVRAIRSCLRSPILSRSDYQVVSRVRGCWLVTKRAEKC